MSDTQTNPDWWQASDGRWYPPEQQAGAPAVATPGAMARQNLLPPGVTVANPWSRLGSYLLEIVLMTVTLGIGWLIWAATIAGTGQTPAKRIMGHRVIDVASRAPVGFGKMFWVRGLLAGIVAAFAIPITIGILLLMPFWDKRNQNLWDKVSGTYVVADPNDHWNLKPDLEGEGHIG